MTAIVVTRGDVELDRILETLTGFGEVIVWVNGTGPVVVVDGELRGIGERENDLAVYGRYAALDYASLDVVYVQDDDCVINAEGLIAVADQVDVTTTIVSNMPESRWADYPDSCLVGWGAVFARDLPARAFDRLRDVRFGWPWGQQFTDTFYRECDAVFTTLTPHVKVDCGFAHLPWAEDPARAMFKKPGRDAERARIYDFARTVRDAA